MNFFIVILFFFAGTLCALAGTVPENSGEKTVNASRDAMMRQDFASPKNVPANDEFLKIWEAAKHAAEHAGEDFGNREADVKRYAEALFSRSKREKNISTGTVHAAVVALALGYNCEKRTGGGVAADALSFYESVVFKFPETFFAAEALFRQSVVCTKIHNFESAFEHLQVLIKTYPGSDRIGDALTQGYLIAEMVRQGARPYKWEGRLPWLKNRNAAMRFYEALYENAPNSPIAPKLLFQKGMFAYEISHEIFESERVADAVDSLERLIINHPSSELVPESYLTLAKIYAEMCVGDEWDQTPTRQAINYYTDFYSLFPEHEKAEFAFNCAESLRNLLAENRAKIGDFYYSKHNNLRAAVVFYNEAITVASGSEAAKNAAEKIAKIRQGIRADRTLVDWLFGRYPAPATTDFLDAPSQRSLDSMGFQQVSAPGEEQTSERSGKGQGQGFLEKLSQEE